MLHRALAAVALLIPLAGQNTVSPVLSEPAISPDRSEIAFISGGDIWTVAASGGEARLLVSHPATEARPKYSPDGTKVAFSSTRTGNGDIYLLDLSSAQLRRLTFDDYAERVDNWSRDGKYIYFSTTGGDIAGMSDVYRIAAEGGTPMPFSADRYASEYYAAPGDNAVAITTKGVMPGQWWRRGHSHMDETEIWLMRDGQAPGFEKVTAGGAKETWPMWSADQKRLYFMSDRGGTENIWEKPAAGAVRQVTQFKDGRVLFPSISHDGKAMVFERDFRVWTLDTASGKSAPVNITLRGVPATPAIEHTTLSNQFGDLAVSKDGKKIAFIVRGDVFAASSKDGGSAARITSTPGLESNLTWSPDNARVTYVSYRNGPGQIFVYDLSTQMETQITSRTDGDYAPQWSPDGKLLAFVRGGLELRVYDAATKQERAVAKTVFPKPPLIFGQTFAWSPDNKWIAYVVSGNRRFRNLQVVPAEGGTAIPISFVPNVFGSSIAWSPDGTYLLFDTGQRTENARIAKIDLIPRTPKFREDQFRDLFIAPRPIEPVKPAPEVPAPESPKPDQAIESATKAQTAKSPIESSPAKPVKIVAEGIRNRLSLLPVGMDADSVVISPDGKQLLFRSSAAGQTNLYLYSLDELAREPAVPRQLTSTAGQKSDPQFSTDGKEVYYLENGRVAVTNVDTRQNRALTVTAEMDTDFSKQKALVFQQAWSYLNDHFYDPKFHGVDWSAARDKYRQHAAGARTPDELRRVISLMIGELNASHLGVSAPGGSAADIAGRLGLRFDRKEYESSGRLRISEVIPLGPVDLMGDVKPGWYLLAIDGMNLDGAANVDEQLLHKINKRVQLTLARQADGTGRQTFAVRPVSAPAEKNLLYRGWVESRREYVAKQSGGRLGYVHMPDMGAQSLDRLYLDLDVENMSRDGVVVDIRNNNGGFVNAYALDVFARRPYLNMTFRGFDDAAPARSVLGQRSLELPTILVINQHSLSDAEDFTEGYRSLKLGSIVGTPTAGWIIYTGGTTLIDGSVLRLPFIRVTSIDGTNMERNPRPVDVLVDRPHGESYSGKDTQLDTAVRELLKQIDSKKGSPRRTTSTGGQ